MTTDLSGPWNQDQIDLFLHNSKLPMRLACVANDDYPRVASLWFRYENGHLLSATHENSKIAKILRQNNRVGFEISPNEPPYHGLRGQATVSIQALGEKNQKD